LLAVATVPFWLLFLQWRPSRSALVAAILLNASSFAVVQGVKLQQLTLLVAGLIAVAAALLVREHLIVPGILLAVATIKPQLTAPLSAWLFLWALSDWRTRKRFVLSFALTLAVLAAGSEWLLPGWIVRFQEAVVAYRVYTGSTGGVLDSLIGHSAGRIVTVGMILLTAVLCWRARKASTAEPSFAWMTLLVLAVTVVIVPTIAPYNQALLLPVVLCVARQWPQFMKLGVPARFIAMFCSVAVMWPWLGACALMVSSVFSSPERVQQWWALPLYSSLFLPLCVLWLQALSWKRSEG
jgi:hypothetical protein